MAKLKSKPVVVRAVRANAGVEAWYRAKLQCVVKCMAESMLLHVRAAYNRADPLIGFASDAPDNSLLMRRAMAKWGGLWTRRLNKLSLSLSEQFAKRNQRVTEKMVSQAFKDAGFTVEFRPTAASKEAYRAVAAEQVNLIRSIPAQYLKGVQSSVWTSVMKGGDMATLAAEIQRQYGLAYKRAALIARDQNHKAKAVIENTRRQELGITEAIWRHSGAGKEPRPEHVAASGKRFKLKEGMYLEGVWTWPGMEINCRCTSSAVLPGFGDDD